MPKWRNEGMKMKVHINRAIKLKRAFKKEPARGEVGEHMLYTTNEDVPGIIGTLGATMGKGGVNIANFTLGRANAGGEAIALLYLDEAPNAAVLKELEGTGLFRQIKPLEFDLA